MKKDAQKRTKEKTNKHAKKDISNTFSNAFFSTDILLLAEIYWANSETQ